MALDVVALCATAAEQDADTSFSTVLAVVFAVYILVDSALASWVIIRKSREAEHASLKPGVPVVPGSVVGAF